MKDLPIAISQSKVRQSFKRGLTTYHTNATHQAEIAMHLCQALTAVAPKAMDRVLEFGMGTGHLTQNLVDHFDIKSLFLNDLVDACASYAPPSARFLPGAVETLPLPGSLDLICSASTIQWIDDLPAAFARLSTSLKSGGFLALSGFGTAQFHELNALGSTAAAPSYLDAGAWKHILPADLSIQYLHHSTRIEWFPNAMAVLKHLRDTGVNGGSSQSWSMRDLRNFETHYRERFGTAKGLPLTYAPVWMIAKKA